MKKRLIISLALALVMVFSLASLALAGPNEKGNGLPKGKSYNFNVIAVPKQKQNWDINSGGNGSRIFILRTGTTQFYVQGQDDTFAIVDHDGTDGKVGVGGAGGLTTPGIILPYDTSSGQWKCTVYVRLLGPNKPGDEAKLRWTTYYWDGYWASLDQFWLNRSSKFDVPGGQIFKDQYQDILWEWDQKHNLRICQFRIFVEE